MKKTKKAKTSKAKKAKRTRGGGSVAGFVDMDGIFHPIRGSAGYSAKRAGERSRNPLPTLRAIGSKPVRALVSRLRNGTLHIQVERTKR